MLISHHKRGCWAPSLSPEKEEQPVLSPLLSGGEGGGRDKGCKALPGCWKARPRQPGSFWSWISFREKMEAAGVEDRERAEWSRPCAASLRPTPRVHGAGNTRWPGEPLQPGLCLSGCLRSSLILWSQVRT